MVNIFVYLVFLLAAIGLSLGDTTIYFRKGQSTTLKCSQRSISPPISWYGPPGLQIYSEGSQTSQRLTHVKITGNQQIGESNLEISMLTNSAEGLYRCSAGFQIEENFTLVLRRPPKNLQILDKRKNIFLDGQEGQQIHIRCVVQNGIPPVTVYLKRNTTIISHGSGVGYNVSYSFVPTREDNSGIIECSTKSPDLEEQLNDTAVLFIKYLPKVNIDGNAEIFINEGEAFKVSCHVASNPDPFNITWVDEKDETVSSSKDLVLPIITRRDAGAYKCHAANEIGIDEQYVDVVVQYPPDVYIEKQTGDDTIKLSCVATGIPSKYDYLPWQHLSDTGHLIRSPFGLPNGTLILPRTNYQNSGSYICSVSNGIFSRNGVKYRNSSTDIRIQDIPRFVAGNRKNQYGIHGERVKLNVKIRSFPNISDVKITAEDGKTKLASIENNIQISDIWYGVKVNIFGFVVSFTLQYIEYSDFQNYTFLVTNGEGSSYYTVQFQSADRPSIPENITITELATGFIVRWTSGYNGGFQQSFFIQYRLKNTNNWSLIGPFNDTRNNVFQLDGLVPSYDYELRMFSRNLYGSSNVTEMFEVQTLGYSTNQQNIFFLSFTTGGGFLMICTLTVLFVHIYKQCNKTTTNPGTDNNHMHIYDEIDELTVREDLIVEPGTSMISPHVIVNIVTAFNSDNDSETSTKNGEVDQKSSIMVENTMNAFGSDSNSETSSKSDYSGIIEKCMSHDDEYLNPYQTLMKEFTQQKHHEYGCFDKK